MSSRGRAGTQRRCGTLPRRTLPYGLAPSVPRTQDPKVRQIARYCSIGHPNNRPATNKPCTSILFSVPNNRLVNLAAAGRVRETQATCRPSTQNEFRMGRRPLNGAFVRRGLSRVLRRRASGGLPGYLDPSAITSSKLTAMSCLVGTHSTFLNRAATVMGT